MIWRSPRPPKGHRIMKGSGTSAHSSPRELYRSPSCSGSSPPTDRFGSGGAPARAVRKAIAEELKDAEAEREAEALLLEQSPEEGLSSPCPPAAAGQSIHEDCMKRR